MNKNKSLTMNYIMNTIFTISSFLFSLITFPYISRILLPVGTGKVSFATSVVSYFSMIAQLGIPTYGIRACAKIRDNRIELTRTVHELLIINFVMDIISYTLLVLALKFIPRLYNDRVLYIIVSATILLQSIGIEWLYKALEQYTYITIRSIIFKFIAFIAMFVLIHKQEDYIVYGAVSIFATSASNILNFINAHKYIDLKIVGKYNLKRHLKSIGIFFAMACAVKIYTNLDMVMLGIMKTDEDVGYYNAAVKVKIILVSIVISLGTVLLPRASYYIENRLIDEFKRMSSKAMNFVILLAAPLTVYFMFYAKECILILSGSAYFGAIIPMQAIMPTLFFIGITNILGIQILVPLGREKVVLYSEIAGALTDLIMNAILIPKYAATGAAIGTVVAEFVVLIVQIIFLKSEIADILKKIKYFKIIIAICLGSVFSFWIKGVELGNLAKLLISSILFFGTYGMTLIIIKEQLALEIFKQIVERIWSLFCNITGRKL